MNYRSFDDDDVDAMPRTRQKQHGLDYGEDDADAHADAHADATESSNHHHRVLVVPSSMSSGEHSYHNNNSNHRNKSRSGNQSTGTSHSTGSPNAGGFWSRLLPSRRLPQNASSANHSSSSPSSSSSLMYKPSTDVHDVRFRGFSSSISDLFITPDQERVDCCAITCCGILQTDRDRFLLQGITPPSIIKRLFVHVMIPIFIFVAAGYGALKIRDTAWNQAVSTSLVVMFFAYFVGQCYKGRSKRIEIRKDLLYTKYQIQRQTLAHRHQTPKYASILEMERPDDEDENNHNNINMAVTSIIRSNNIHDPVYYMGQKNNDFACAHPCCLLSCYRQDRDASNSSHPPTENMCRRLWTCLCPSLCGSHLQCCGMCAVAQEGREVEFVILPPPFRQIDYISTLIIHSFVFFPI
jgi:hypothetical protein